MPDHSLVKALGLFPKELSPLASGELFCIIPVQRAVAHALGTRLAPFQRIVTGPRPRFRVSFVEGQAPAVLRVTSTSEFLSRLRAQPG